MYRPLADELRPQSLDDVVGQSEILGEDSMLRRIIDSKQIPNMIFYGPSGTGKTTVASIIADKTNRALRKLNATTSGIADIKAIIDELDTLMAPEGVRHSDRHWHRARRRSATLGARGRYVASALAGGRR